MTRSPPSAVNLKMYDKIYEALMPYITAAKTGAPGTLRASWFDHARIVGSVDGSFITLDPDAYVSWVESNGSSLSIEHHIVSIDVSGRAASVRIEFSNWLGFRFTDFFLLYEHEGVWRISGKVFDAHDRA